MFFLLVFFVTLINLSIFFYFVALNNFSKNRFNVVVFSMFFFTPSLIRFLGFFWSKTEKLKIVA